MTEKFSMPPSKAALNQTNQCGRSNHNRSQRLVRQMSVGNGYLCPDVIARPGSRDWVPTHVGSKVVRRVKPEDTIVHLVPITGHQREQVLHGAPDVLTQTVARVSETRQQKPTKKTRNCIPVDWLSETSESWVNFLSQIQPSLSKSDQSYQTPLEWPT